MVHGRMIRPPVAGAVPVKVDESSIKDIPGAQVVCEKGFLGVVADKEWDAIRAAREAQGRVVEGRAAVPDQSDALRPHPQGAGAQGADRARPNGNVDEAFKTAAKVIEAEYEWPFQSHAAWDRPARWSRSRTARSTCWTGTQKPHFVQHGVAATLGMPRREGARASGQIGPGSYGRNDADDARWTAAVLAKAVGKPVRAAIHARRGHRLGPEGPGLDPHARAPRSTRRATSSPTSSSARASRASTSTPTAASRSTRWPARRSASR